MPVYDYCAFNQLNNKQTGQIEAESARAARQKLRDNELIPISLSTATLEERKKYSHRSVPHKSIALFTQQFAALIQSNIPLEEALRVSAAQTRHKHLKMTLQEMREKVLAGHSVADSMKDYPKVFSPIFQALVKAGEHTGELSKVLLKLSEYTERSEKLRNKVIQAIAYPIVLIIAAIAIISLLMVFVIPKVVSQIADTGQELPLLTKIMIGTSSFIIEYGVWLAGTFAVFSVIWHYLLKNEKVRLKVHRCLLALPVVGFLIINLETTRLLGTLSIMLNGGSALLDALKVSNNIIHNRVIKIALLEVSEQVRAGQLLSKMLGDAKIFPPISIYIVANGEHSGELSLALEQAAQQQENELNNSIGIVTKLIEPILMLIFGLITFAIVLAILLPILQMNNFSNI